MDRLVDIFYGMDVATEPGSALTDLIIFQELLMDAYDELLEWLDWTGGTGSSGLP